MDAVLSLVGHAVKQFAFEFVLFWSGWLALKILTFGKYPRLARPIKDIEDYSAFQAISYFCPFVVLLSSALFFKFFPA